MSETIINHVYNLYQIDADEHQQNSSTIFNDSSTTSAVITTLYRPYDSFIEEEHCMNHNVNNVSYLNVTCETILNYSIPLYGFCMPFLLFITVTANSLIVLVLSKRNMATPTNMVLMGKFYFIYFIYIVQ